MDLFAFLSINHERVSKFIVICTYRPKEIYIGMTAMASNQTFNIKIGRNQLFELVSQLSAKDKNDLIKELQAKSYLDRFNELLSQLKTDEVSIDEIIAEVDVVRNKRFESGKPDLQYS